LSGTLRYLDSSAVAKLVLSEPESPALLEALSAWPDLVSSALSRVEVLRAVRRARAGVDVEARAEGVLDRIALRPISEDVLSRAIAIDPETLRSLDAIHLATALSFGEELESFVAYDAALSSAARDAGLDVLAPS
jgi:predicted nucleic acid-binding protein